LTPFETVDRITAPAMTPAEQPYLHRWSRPAYGQVIDRADLLP
jgi:hypothetical protein